MSFVSQLSPELQAAIAAEMTASQNVPTHNPFEQNVPVQNVPQVQQNWRNHPATIDQLFGKKDFSTGKRKGGLVLQLRTRDLSQFPAGELRDLLASLWSPETKRFEFEIDETQWVCHQLTKGQASDIMGTLLQLPKIASPAPVQRQNGNGSNFRRQSQPSQLDSQQNVAAEVARQLAALGIYNGSLTPTPGHQMIQSQPVFSDAPVVKLHKGQVVEIDGKRLQVVSTQPGKYRFNATPVDENGNPI